MWKGVIRFGSISVPIKFYAGVSDRKVHFRLLHRTDHAPVQQRMVHPDTGQPIAPDKVRRGYEIEPGEIILLDEADLKVLEPPESREISITRFVRPEQISHQWFDRPYYLGPDGKKEVYAAFVLALREQRLAGVARWTMRKKAYFGALNAASGYLKMMTLRHADDIVDVSDLQAPQSRELTRPELRMAQQLVDALEDKFDPHAFKDDYTERVRALVMTKARGETPSFPKAEPRPSPVISLADMLKQSIKNAQEEKRKIARA